MTDPNTPAEVDIYPPSFPAAIPTGRPRSLSDAELDARSGGLTASPRPSGPAPISVPNTA